MSSITNITISDYSEKSFVVRGDTEKHKEALKILGGKWNALLRDGSGWIFPSTKKDEVKKWKETGDAPQSKSRISYYHNNAQQQYTSPVVSSDTTVLYSEIRKLNNKIDRLENLILKLLKKEEDEEEEILVLANSSDDEEVEVPRKRLLGGR